MKINRILAELKDRRVIRATLMYVALAWVAFQAADLLAGAELISERTVRWLIIISAVGFPIMLLGSWFLESPWRESKRLAVAGDIVIIIAIGIAAFLFAWQQWFVSFARPSLVVQALVATDTRDETQWLAERISRNLRTLLATRPELRVLEMGGASANADYRVAGTLARRDSTVRATVQLFESGDDLLWSDSFEGQLTDEKSLLNRIQSELWSRLPLAKDAMMYANKLVAMCESLAERDVLIARAQNKFDEMDALPPPRRPIAQQLAMQYLSEADAICPGWPDTELLRLDNTLQLERESIDDENFLQRFPNSAVVYRKLAGRRFQEGDKDEARALYIEACQLQRDPEMPYCD